MADRVTTSHEGGGVGSGRSRRMVAALAALTALALLPGTGHLHRSEPDVPGPRGSDTVARAVPSPAPNPPPVPPG
jgi:hypothetical protein